MLVPALFTGCIKEDMDDCMNVAVCFQYNADGQDNVLQNYIHDINLYTFTTNGSIHSRILSTLCNIQYIRSIEGRLNVVRSCRGPFYYLIVDS